MKTLPTVIGLSLLAVLCAGVWVLRYHPEWVQPSAEAEEEEDLDPQSLEIPVYSATVVRATLHRYVDAIGVVDPAPQRPGQMAGTADVAAPIASVIAQVLCEPGQVVKQGDPLMQLDDRLAAAAERQAAAALTEARAVQARLKATPRPEQLNTAQLRLEQARKALDFARRNHARQEELAKSQGTSEKSLEQAQLDLAAAQNDVALAENELALLKPTAEELAEEQARVAAAEAALAAAQAQRELFRIIAPIDGTIVAVTGNPGESVDTSKVLIGIVALDRLVVDIRVPAQQAESLEKGKTAQIFTNSTDSEADPVEGRVYFVGAEVDRTTNTIPVAIDLPPGSGVRPGQSVHVRIVAEVHADCLAVPTQCVITNEDGETVIAVLDGDQATQKGVEVGLREAGLTEVRAEGLNAGDAVVGSGAYGLAAFPVAKVTVMEK